MQNFIDYKNITKIGLIVRINSNLDEEISYIKKILKEKNIKVFVFFLDGKNINDLDEIFIQSDFIISLGGDGTLISLCVKAYKYKKAILGINAGRLGFLTDFKAEHSKVFFDDFFNGKFKIEEPYLLDIFLEDENSNIINKVAFNDVVFHKDKTIGMADIKVYENKKIFNEYYGDGLIISTPAGSTAYNISANGPIIYALAEVFVLTPVCSHSLTQRPIVLPKGFIIELGAKDCIFCIDGRETLNVNDYKSIKIALSDKKVTLIRPFDRNYFQVLKEKLHWGS